MGKSPDEFEREVKRGDRRQLYLICALLILATLAVYWQVAGFDFTNLDDSYFVRDNPFIANGLTPAGVQWSLTTTYQNTWVPLVWMSYMVDHDLSSLIGGFYLGNADPRVCHVTNLLLHIANVLLLFLVLASMTRRPWQSAFVAALFAVHPLHVESVAWITERKDVLSTLFWLLTMLAYLRYVGRPDIRRYALVLLVFAVGLMSKPMLVTLPIVLLLVDYWPLRRSQSEPWRRLILEKIPLFVLSAAAAVVTLLAQAVTSFAKIGLTVRPANAIVSYMAYIRKMIWPTDLACFYPHPGSHLPIWQVLGSCLFVAGFSVAVIRLAPRRPYLSVGWFWYMITLLPVIGIVQVGDQAMADRYTYVPLIGLYVLIAWAVPELLARVPHKSIVLMVVAGIAITGLMIRAHNQVGCWRDSKTLFRHAIAVTSANWMAEFLLGAAFVNEGNTASAYRHIRISLRYNPRYANAHYTLGLLLEVDRRFSEAIYEYRQAIRWERTASQPHMGLGRVLQQRGRLSEALRQFEEAQRLDPGNEPARENVETLRNELGLDK